MPRKELALDALKCQDDVILGAFNNIEVENKSSVVPQPHNYTKKCMHKKAFRKTRKQKAFKSKCNSTSLPRKALPRDALKRQDDVIFGALLRLETQEFKCIEVEDKSSGVPQTHNRCCSLFSWVASL